MKDLFKRTKRDMEMYTKFLDSIGERAIDLGMEAQDLTVQRAFLKCNAAIKEHIEDRNSAQEMGYKSVKMLIKAFKQIKSHKTLDIGNLPSIFHAVPNIWLSGKVDTRRSQGFKPLALSAALRKHRVITPLLIEAWTLTNGDESIQDEIVNSYLSRSADEFEKELYRYIYDLEEIPLEEELQNAAALISSDFEASATLKELRNDYGAGGVMEEVTWDDE